MQIEKGGSIQTSSHRGDDPGIVVTALSVPAAVVAASAAASSELRSPPVDGEAGRGLIEGLLVELGTRAEQIPRPRLVEIQCSENAEPLFWNAPIGQGTTTDRAIVAVLRRLREVVVTAPAAANGVWKLAGHTISCGALYEGRRVQISFAHNEVDVPEVRRVALASRFQHQDGRLKWAEMWDIRSQSVRTELTLPELAQELSPVSLRKSRAAGNVLVHAGGTTFEVSSTQVRGRLYDIFEATLNAQESVTFDAVLADDATFRFFGFEHRILDEKGAQARICFTKDQSGQFTVTQSIVYSVMHRHKADGKPKKKYIFDSAGRVSTELSLAELAAEINAERQPVSDTKKILFEVGDDRFELRPAKNHHRRLDDLFQQELAKHREISITVPPQQTVYAYGIYYDGTPDWTFASHVRVTLQCNGVGQFRATQREAVAVNPDGTSSALFTENRENGAAISLPALSELLDIYRAAPGEPNVHKEYTLTVDGEHHPFVLRHRQTNSSMPLQLLAQKVAQLSEITVEARLTGDETFRILGLNGPRLRNPTWVGRQCCVRFNRLDDQLIGVEGWVLSDAFSHPSGQPKVQERSNFKHTLTTELSTGELIATAQSLPYAKDLPYSAQLWLNGMDLGEVHYNETSLFRLLRESLRHEADVRVRATVMPNYVKVLGLTWTHQQPHLIGGTADIWFSQGRATRTEIRDAASKELIYQTKMAPRRSRAEVEKERQAKAERGALSTSPMIPKAESLRFDEILNPSQPPNVRRSWQQTALNESDIPKCSLPAIDGLFRQQAIEELISALEAVPDYSTRPLTVRCRLSDGRCFAWKAIPGAYVKEDRAIQHFLLQQERFTLTGAQIGGRNGEWTLYSFGTSLSGMYQGRVPEVTFRRTSPDEALRVARIRIPSRHVNADGQPKVAEDLDFVGLTCSTELSLREIASELREGEGFGRTDGSFTVYDGKELIEIPNIVGAECINNLPIFVDQSLAAWTSVIIEGQLTRMGFHFRDFQWQPGLSYLHGCTALILFVRSGTGKFSPAHVSVFSTVARNEQGVAKRNLIMMDGQPIDTDLSLTELSLQMAAHKQYDKRPTSLTIEAAGERVTVRPPPGTSSFFDDAFTTSLKRYETLNVITDAPKAFRAYGLYWCGAKSDLANAVYRITYNRNRLTSEFERTTLEVGIRSELDGSVSPLYRSAYDQKFSSFVPLRSFVELVNFYQTTVSAAESDCAAYIGEEQILFPNPQRRDLRFVVLFRKALEAYPSWGLELSVGESGIFACLGIKRTIGWQEGSRTAKRCRLDVVMDEGQPRVARETVFSNQFYWPDGKSKVEVSRDIENQEYFTELSAAELLQCAAERYPQEDNQNVRIQLEDGATFVISDKVRRTLMATIVGQVLRDEREVKISCSVTGNSFSVFGLRFGPISEVGQPANGTVVFSFGEPQEALTMSKETGEVLFSWKRTRSRISAANDLPNMPELLDLM